MNPALSDAHTSCACWWFLYTTRQPQFLYKILNTSWNKNDYFDSA